MSNIYGVLEKNVTRIVLTINGGDEVFESYDENMRLSLTAFMGGAECLQITIQTSSDIDGHNGIGFITLTPKEIKKLIGALNECLEHKITSTGEERSKYLPIKEENE